MNKNTRAPNQKYYSESITTIYDKNPLFDDFCSLHNIHQEWVFENISENSEADLLRTTTELRIDDEITIVMFQAPIPFIVDNVTFNDPYYEVDTSAVTLGEIPEFTFFTDTRLEVGLIDTFIPNKICDFYATDYLYKEIKCTWSTPLGNPEPTFDVINADTNEVLGSDVSSGFTLSYPDITDDFTINLAVIAKNTEGQSTSNIDQGLATGTVPDIIDFTATDDQCNRIYFNWTPLEVLF